MKKKKASTILLFVLLFIGLSLLLYPSVADYWNSKVQSKAIMNYIEMVSSIDDETYQELWEAAKAYNASILDRTNPYLMTDEQKELYDQLLNVSGTGIMGYIEIPSIGVSLPVYHGTEDSVLSVAIGHMNWTSLPAGGENSHCALSGHRGLPSARLFTDLDQLRVGDCFMLYILDETLTYEVDQILTVDPDEAEDLLIVEGEDLVTLVTCTPYGVNTHRMLVRGHRVDNLEEEVTVRVTADATVVDRLIVAPFVLVPILLVMLTVMLITTRKRK